MTGSSGLGDTELYFLGDIKDLSLKTHAFSSEIDGYSHVGDIVMFVTNSW